MEKMCHQGGGGEGALSPHLNRILPPLPGQLINEEMKALATCMLHVCTCTIHYTHVLCTYLWRASVRTD